MRVELQAAQAAHLFAAAGVTGAAVQELRQDGSGTHRLAGDLFAAEVDAAVKWSDGENALAQEVAIVAVHRADQAASAAPDQFGRIARRGQRGDRTEDFVGVHQARGGRIAREQESGRNKIALGFRYFALEDRLRFGG